ncbi:hypothetical protein FDP41_002004 [Naegleria fowleri]|uniref:G domain-containing protein n=1 Tax=Naegleria fowleri TaxID=5763 RepID=A0A6A5BX92_NAEFO|nr:uncharacterized protein FDP41_002004 [Naegleria fowleri]KAF0978934.1 hypothetical protein FDP41_002004 [Naegleria fowleri]
MNPPNNCSSEESSSPNQCSPTVAMQHDSTTTTITTTSHNESSQVTLDDDIPSNTFIVAANNTNNSASNNGKTKIPLLNIIASMKLKSSTNSSSTQHTHPHHQHHSSSFSHHLIENRQKHHSKSPNIHQSPLINIERERSHSTPPMINTSSVSAATSLSPTSIVIEHMTDQDRVLPSCPLKADKHIFVLGDQSVGKTTWIRELASTSQNIEEFISDFRTTASSTSGLSKRSMSTGGFMDGLTLSSSPTLDNSAFYDTMINSALSPQQENILLSTSPRASGGDIQTSPSTATGGKLSQWINNLRSSKSNQVPSNGGTAGSLLHKKSASLDVVNFTNDPEALMKKESENQINFVILLFQQYLRQLELETLLYLYHPENYGKYLFPPSLKKLLGIDPEDDSDYYELVIKIGLEEFEDLQFEGLYELYKRETVFKLTIWDQRNAIDINFEEIPTIVQIKKLLTYLGISQKKYSAKLSFNFRTNPPKTLCIQDFLRLDTNEFPSLDSFFQKLCYKRYCNDFNVTKSKDNPLSFMILFPGMLFRGSNFVPRSLTEYSWIKFGNNTAQIIECETVEEMSQQMNYLSLYDQSSQNKADIIFYMVSLQDFATDKTRQKYFRNCIQEWRKLMQDERFKSCPIVLIGNKTDLVNPNSPVSHVANLTSKLDSCQAEEDMDAFREIHVLSSDNLVDAKNISFSGQSTTSSDASPLTLSMDNSETTLVKSNSNPSLTASPRLSTECRSPRARSQSTPKEPVLIVPKTRKKLSQFVIHQFLEEETVSQGRKTQLVEDYFVGSCRFDEDMIERSGKILSKYITTVKTTRFGVFGSGCSGKSTIYNHLVKIVNDIEKDVNTNTGSILTPSIMFFYYVKTIAMGWKKLLELVNAHHKSKQHSSALSTSIIEKRKSEFTLNLKRLNDEPLNTKNANETGTKSNDSSPTHTDPILSNRETTQSILNQKNERAKQWTAEADKLKFIDGDLRSLYVWCLQTLAADVNMTIKLFTVEISDLLNRKWKNDRVLKETWEANYLQTSASKIQNLPSLMSHMSEVQRNNLATLYLQSPRKNSHIPKISLSTFLKTYTTVNGLVTDVFNLRGQKCSVTVTRGSRRKHIQQWSMTNNCVFDVIFYVVNIANYNYSDHENTRGRMNEENEGNDEENDEIISLSESIIFFKQLLNHFVANNAKGAPHNNIQSYTGCVPYLVFTHKDLFVEKVEKGIPLKEEYLSEKGSFDLGLGGSSATNRANNEKSRDLISQIKLSKTEVESIQSRLRSQMSGIKEQTFATFIISKYVECALEETLRSMIIANTFVIDATNEKESAQFIHTVLDKRVVSDFEIDYELGLGSSLVIGGKFNSFFNSMQK